jgi:4-amino-4-deoxy-L-arabinose transferase-like glycosyltransferase
MMTARSFSLERPILALVVLAYLALGVLYAVLTPPWQVPDEPAHYNYVRYLVEEGRLPVLRMGDYDQAYLSEATSRRFDPALAIDPIRYEFHQPPLYYLLAAPVYLAFGGALVPLRLLSVLLGAGLVVVAYLVGKAVFPHRAWPALGTAALVAFVPQHIAMTAAVENDTLAELILGIVLLGLVRWLGAEGKGSGKRLVVTGVFIGLALLTKVGVYIAVPLALLAVVLKFRGGRPDVRPALGSTLALMLPALILGLPWFIRNAIVYGGLDVMGLGRHAQVVVGQLRTSEWIAQHGWVRLPGVFLATTFHSFWAQFGWMAVPVDSRIYAALGLLCLVVLLGLVLWGIDAWGSKLKLSSPVLLLGFSALLTLGTYLGYNLGFYQAQGRYMFPALIPLGLAWSFGLHKALDPGHAPAIGLAMGLGTVLGGIKWLVFSSSDKWRMMMSGLCAVCLGGRRLLPAWTSSWLFVLPYLFLIGLCAVSPFWFIVPYLAP